MLKFGGSSDIKLFVKERISRMSIGGKRVLDVPAGKGFTTKLLREAGAEVVAYDLFPEVFEYDGVECKEADLMLGLPEKDASVDMIVCQEGIEHLPDQLAALREFNRVLKPNGTLLLTTPNISHLRAKISNVFVESELYSRMPPNELDALWYANDEKMYFGHIFLIGIQKLRVLGVASGFRLKKIHTVKASTGALLYAPLYPFIVLVNVWSYLKNVYRDNGIDKAEKKRVYGELIKLNLHPGILFGRHIFVEFEKVSNFTNVDVRVITSRY